MAILNGLTVNDTGFLRLPQGTTANRPANSGWARYNGVAVEWAQDGSGDGGVYWANLIPSGAVRYFARNAAPDGWLKANGAAVSRTTYSTLFAAIGTTWGAGNGSTTFNLPDLRGEFVRGWDNNRGVDTNRNLATYQAQDWKGFFQSNTGSNTFAYSHGPVYMGKSTTGYVGNLFLGWWSAPGASWYGSWDTSEIRPRNTALLACIKF